MTTRALSALLLSLSLVACGGGAQSSTTTSSGSSDGTSGGETAQAEAHPIRTTTPIPVPTPAIAREQMSPGVQRVWELVELAVAMRPPEPPSDHSLEGVNAWAQGPFAAWIQMRGQATNAVQEAILPLEEAPGYERGVAAGLMGYVYETTCSDVRGAPVPDTIAGDPELLRVYDESMQTALVPYARVALQAYAFCVAAFSEAEDPAWSEWAEYCNDRGTELTEVYQLGTGGETASSAATIATPEQ